ncbi:MAG: lipopolysaccharide biosynthesis protein [bacterium]
MGSEQQHSGAERAKSGSFAGNVARLSAGEGVAQIIAVLSLPVLARLYASSEFGIFSIFTSVLTILFPLTTLRYNNAMMLPEKESEAANLLALSIAAVLGFGLLAGCAVALYVLLPSVQARWPVPAATAYLALMPPSMIIAGCAQAMIFWALRQKMFTPMAASRVVESVSDKALAITAGALLGGSALWLIAARMVGPLLGAFYLARTAVLSSLGHLRRQVSLREMSRLARRYKDFALFSNFAFLINNLYRELPLIFLAGLFSVEVAGYYGLAMRAVKMPTQLLGEAISRAFFQLAAAQGGRREGLAKDTVKLLRSLLTASLPLLAVLILLGRPIFEILFGSEWREAGRYCEILAAYVLVFFVFRPLSVLFDVFEKQRERLLFNVVVLAAQSGVLLLGSRWTGSAPATLMLFTAVSVVIHAAGCGYLLRLAGVRLAEVCGIVASKLAGMLPLAVGLGVSRSLLPGHPASSAMVLATCFLAQGWWMVRHDPEAREVTGRILLRFRRPADGRPNP